jgi:hypothetical protein
MIGRVPKSIQLYFYSTHREKDAAHTPDDDKKARGKALYDVLLVEVLLAHAVVCVCVCVHGPCQGNAASLSPRTFLAHSLGPTASGASAACRRRRQRARSRAGRLSRRTVSHSAEAHSTAG